MVKDFSCEILDGWFYFYFFFRRCTVENILQLRLEYKQSLYTRQELRDINELTNFAGCTLEDAKYIVAERKKFLQDGLQCDLSDSIRYIYGKNSFSKIPVPDKINIEKYCVLNQIPLRCAEYSIKKYLMETKFPGLWEICLALKNKEDNNLCLEYRSKHTPKIEIPKKSKFLELKKILPKEPFEWITTRRRIILEGEEMHHCVASYAERINRDTCAVYSFIYPENQKRYTIEFHANAGGIISYRYRASTTGDAQKKFVIM